MAEVTVGELAKSIGAPVERLLKQMHEAGLEHKSADAKISDDETQRLLSFLKGSHGEAAVELQKVNLQSKTAATINPMKGNERKAIDVKARTKRTYVKREAGTVHSSSSIDGSEAKDEDAFRVTRTVNAIQLEIEEMTDPLVPGEIFTGYVKGVEDGNALISIAEFDVPVKIEKSFFTGSWPAIGDGKRYPKFEQEHQMSLTVSGRSITFNRMILPPKNYALVVLESPEIHDLRYIPSNFLITPVSGDQVLYISDECTIFSDGDWTTNTPKVITVFHRVEKTGICYEYKVNIKDGAAKEKIGSESILRPEDESLGSDLNEAVKTNQINYTPTRRQLPEAISDEDHLNRQPLISALAAVLAHKSNSEHQTIGLLGDWGIGKSTWLRLLKKELLAEHKEQAYLFGEFNAWAYEHTDNLQAGIAQEVIKALSSPATRLEDIDHALADQIMESKFALFRRWLVWKYDRAILTAKFAVRLNGGELLKLAFLLMLALCPLVFSIPELISDYLASKAATQSQGLYRGAGVVGNALWFLGFGVYFVKEFPKLFVNPLAKEMLTYLRLPDYAKHLGTVPVMRKNIETLCNIRLKSSSEKPTRLLFVVDDLDRCGHDGIVKVLEAVRLVLDIKNVTVIIAVDQHIALAALALHYEEVAKHHKLKNPNAIARDYLAKVIHLPIILANPMGADIESYLKRLWLVSTSKEDHEIVEKEQVDYVLKMVADRENSESDRAVALSSKGNSQMQDLNESSSQTTAGAEFINNGVLSPQAPKEPDHLRVNQDTIKRPEVVSLSAAQRRAFIFWLNHFSLTNPRQVKRLNNTYNLLLNCYSDIDRGTVLTDLPDPMPKTLFPMMMALITMEYLNSMGDWELRNELRSQLFLYSGERKDIVLNTEPLTKEFISAFHLLLSEHDRLLEKVRPFVLPAIEMC